MHHQDTLTAAHTLVTSFASLLSPLDDEQKAARKKGLQRYNLGEFLDAEADLTIAATAGDSDAQYALGEVFRRRDGHISEASKALYRKAGEQSHVYALMRLGDADSLEKARKLAQDRADLDDGDAMLQMYELTQDIAWLIRAGTVGNGESIYIRAILSERNPAIRNRSDWDTYLDNLLRRATDLGFPPAMYWLSNRPIYLRHPPSQRYLLEKRLEKNQIGAVLDYAYALSHTFASKADIDRYDFRVSRTKGYGLLWLVVSNTREYIRHDEAAITLKNLGAKLTQEQIDEGKQFANKWEKTHPPLCAYNLTYSDLK